MKVEHETMSLAIPLVGDVRVRVNSVHIDDIQLQICLSIYANSALHVSSYMAAEEARELARNLFAVADQYEEVRAENVA